MQACQECPRAAVDGFVPDDFAQHEVVPSSLQPPGFCPLSAFHHHVPAIRPLGAEASHRIAADDVIAGGEDVAAFQAKPWLPSIGG